MALRKERESKGFGKSFVLVFAIAALALALIAGVPSIWHSAAPNESPEVWLEEYPSIVSEKNACFEIAYSSQPEGFAQGLALKANGKAIECSVEKLNDNSSKVCFNSDYLQDGNNFVDLNFGRERLFFHSFKEVGKLSEKEPALKILGFEKKNDFKGNLSFSIQNSEGINERARISVNGVELRSAFFKDGKQEETIPLAEGLNSVKVEFQGFSESASLENETGWKSNIAFGILALALLLSVLFAFVFGKVEGTAERLSLSIISALCMIALLAYALALLSILSGMLLLALVVLLSVGLAVAFRKNFSIPEIKASFGLFEAFLALVFAALLLVNVFSPTHYSYWTAFYEHQSQAVFEAGSIPFLDEHLNFGEKPYGYVSGYFFANAGISSITGAFGEHSFALLLLLSGLALVLSAFAFFKKAGFDRKKSLLCVMLLLLGSFMFSDFFFTPRHIMALALAFTALSLLYDRKTALAAVAAGVAMLFQAPAIIIIAALAIAFHKGSARELAKFLAGGAALGVLLFAPSLLAHGIPSQASAETWGYLFGMPYYGILVDLLAQVVFFFAIMLPAAKFRPRLDSFSRRVLAVLVILLAVQLFFSYRVNVATIILFSFIGVYFFPQRLLERKRVKAFFFAIFTITAVFMGILLLGFFAPANALSAAEFVNGKTPDSERLLAEPALGHLAAFRTEKRIMSDLAVEYESQQYLDDSFRFLGNGSKALLEKYNVGYVFSRARFIETQPVGSKWLEKPLEFEEIDKVYDNGEFFVHRRA